MTPTILRMISPEHPLYSRVFNDESHNRFVTKWLTPLDKTKLSNPSMAITNGWMSEHHKNQWYADALSDNVNVFAYDSRGTGDSPKEGELNAFQSGIDANSVIGRAFDQLDTMAKEQGIEPGNKILQGNCIGTMTLASLFSGKLPLAKRTDGTILISPVSTFSLPILLKMTYFLPVWFVDFAIKYVAPTVAGMVVPGEDSESSRQEALGRARKLIPPVAVKQTRQVFWKENVTHAWKHINVPSLILVGRHDPLVKLEHSFDPYNRLPYPIWMELKAPDHLILEDNIEELKVVLPKFMNDPWGFYEEFKYLKPDYSSTSNGKPH